MTEFEEYQEHIQYTHNAFCRIVIRHASIDAARKLYSKWKREISLEYLSEEKFMPFAATDEYFAKPPSSEEYPFTVCGQTVMLSNPDLAAALSSLPETEQEISYKVSCFFLRLAVAGIAFPALPMQSKPEKISASFSVFGKPLYYPAKRERKSKKA